MRFQAGLTAVLLLWCWSVAAPVSGQTYPARIVSLGPLNTENVFLLGAGERLVGDTRYCLRPEQAKNRPKVGSVLQISVERVMALRPDLVLATGLTPEATVRRLRSLGIRVERVTQPGSFVKICAEFIRLGTLLGLEERARRIVAAAEQRVNRVGRRVAGLARPRVFLQVGARPLFGAAPGSFTHDFIRLAGGINVLADQQAGLVGREKVLAENPEVIIIAMMGSESGIAAREKEKWLRYPALRAAATGRIHLIDPDLVCSPSPVTFARTLERIAGLIHPQLTLSP